MGLLNFVLFFFFTMQIYARQSELKACVFAGHLGHIIRLRFEKRRQLYAPALICLIYLSPFLSSLLSFLLPHRSFGEVFRRSFKPGQRQTLTPASFRRSESPIRRSLIREVKASSLATHDCTSTGADKTNRRQKKRAEGRRIFDGSLRGP